jgi:GT2 family glycosyltransferase
MRLSISIVNYNAGEHLLKCLESIDNVKKEAEIEIYIVDNASSDDSIAKAKQKFPKAHFIENSKNVGFGAAHNQVLRQIKSGYILVLNPDVILEKGNIQPLLEFMESHSDVGAVTPKIVFDNGKLDLTAHRGFPTPLASFLYFLGNDSLYHLSNRNLAKIHEVDAITGAFFLTSAEVLQKVGYFDEDYFMYAEDIDLCYRIKQAGLKVMYIPDVQVLHFKGVSSGLKKHSQHLTTANLETKKRSLNHFYQTMKIFYDKHYKNKYPFFINWAVYFGIYARWWLAKRKLTV